MDGEVREFFPIFSGRRASRESDLLRLARVVVFSLVSSASNRPSHGPDVVGWGHGRTRTGDRDNLPMPGSRDRPCRGPNRVGRQRSLTRHRGSRPADIRKASGQTSPRQYRTSSDPKCTQGLCLPDRAYADGSLWNGCRQGAGSGQCRWCRADRAHGLAEHRGRIAATGAGYHHQ
jgi:hypothetical protein